MQLLHSLGHLQHAPDTLNTLLPALARTRGGIDTQRAARAPAPPPLAGQQWPAAPPRARPAPPAIFGPAKPTRPPRAPAPPLAQLLADTSVSASLRPKLPALLSTSAPITSSGEVPFLVEAARALSAIAPELGEYAPDSPRARANGRDGGAAAGLPPAGRAAGPARPLPPTVPAGARLSPADRLGGMRDTLAAMRSAQWHVAALQKAMAAGGDADPLMPRVHTAGVPDWLQPE